MCFHTSSIKHLDGRVPLCRPDALWETVFPLISQTLILKCISVIISHFISHHFIASSHPTGHGGARPSTFLSVGVERCAGLPFSIKQFGLQFSFKKESLDQQKPCMYVCVCQRNFSKQLPCLPWRRRGLCSPVSRVTEAPGLPDWLSH